jgi:hypothetical protein
MAVNVPLIKKSNHYTMQNRYSLVFDHVDALQKKKKKKKYWPHSLPKQQFYL